MLRKVRDFSSGKHFRKMGGGGVLGICFGNMNDMEKMLRRIRDFSDQVIFLKNVKLWEGLILRRGYFLERIAKTTFYDPLVSTLPSINPTLLNFTFSFFVTFHLA